MSLDEFVYGFARSKCKDSIYMSLYMDWQVYLGD